ncbi:MAG: hypothetical protein K2K63_10255 [Acetatifactor sp.]|nr:hypothetical protein [Acetatifactor sp.]
MVKVDKCWIIENRARKTLAEIVSISGNLVLIKTQNGKTLRLPKHRIYNSEENADKDIKEHNPVQKKKSPYEYMM